MATIIIGFGVVWKMTRLYLRQTERHAIIAVEHKLVAGDASPIVTII